MDAASRNAAGLAAYELFAKGEIFFIPPWFFVTAGDSCHRITSLLPGDGGLLLRRKAGAFREGGAARMFGDRSGSGERLLPFARVPKIPKNGGGFVNGSRRTGKISAMLEKAGVFTLLEGGNVG